MIVFDLKCRKGHCFEEWFDSGDDYDSKANSRAIACPECGDTNISKALMAPNVSTHTSTQKPACGVSDCGSITCPMAARG